VTGAEALLRTAADRGIQVCFMNPGTTEMPVVAAMDRVPEIRGILCLFEGVCTGAADGYARMTGKPAATLLHLGPGLANGLANLHNARKARSPVFNIVGQHSTGHLRYDAPLTADIEAFARPVSGFVRMARDAADAGCGAVEAIAASYGPPGQVATLIVPSDVAGAEGGGVPPSAELPARRAPGAEAIDRARELLREPGTAVLLGGSAGNPRALAAAGRLGVRVFSERFTPRIREGRGGFQPVAVPYFPEPAAALFVDVPTLILVEAQVPVSFFGYPDVPSYLLPPECEVFVLADRSEDGTAALEELGGTGILHAQQGRPWACPTGPLTADAIGAVLRERLPENAILSDEMVASGGAVLPHLLAAAPHDRLPVTGGSIGQGLPVALGAAVACPDRKVVALEADGSGMYTLQSLWTMARERLDVVTVIFANRRYQILEIELRRAGSAPMPGISDIGGLDWVRLAEGMGVPASCASTVREFDDQFGEAMENRGPRLIEAVSG
jgi:acetolactate synthase-1/2/3 large subunit